MLGWGGGGLALEISSFVGPCEIARVDKRVKYGAQKTRIRMCKSECNRVWLIDWFLNVHTVEKIRRFIVLVQEREFHSAVREVVILALAGLLLYIASFVFLGKACCSASGSGSVPVSVRFRIRFRIRFRFRYPSSGSLIRVPDTGNII